MNTTTHILIAQAVLKRRTIPKSGWAAAAGGLLPDAFLGVFLAASLVRQVPRDELWDVEYFREPWATVGAVSNSFILWGLLTAGGLMALARGRNERVQSTARLVAILAASGLAHTVFDFFTHAEDAHQHLWPVSSWRFESPFSYWDPAHNARWVRPVEGLITLASVAVLWRQTSSKWLKLALSGLAFLGVVMVISVIFR